MKNYGRREKAARSAACIFRCDRCNATSVMKGYVDPRNHAYTVMHRCRNRQRIDFTGHVQRTNTAVKRERGERERESNAWRQYCESRLITNQRTFLIFSRDSGHKKGEFLPLVWRTHEICRLYLRTPSTHQCVKIAIACWCVGCTL